ncbi:OVARIAN TUMOR DOMAIN-containing deubiquitinating enzyme 1-like [Andrographis paniculata]|uniref:OVARIAN TUMOR DOMAIN-containing deubiquitinating enzyme 1-like n=1 Tax=Andrographis paniculata TaxID=175694 RepID=UPI0021E8EAAB|nr:OVARIAN TUMOR DOMAIN-containing deubiquitinating enzyme 1-like [Andrographis paniculata]
MEADNWGVAGSETDVMTSSNKSPEVNSWTDVRDDEIMQQQYSIRDEEAKKTPFVGDKELLSSLAAEYESGNPILLEKVKILAEQYDAIRRTRGDGNCFFRGFMFAYLEHIMESQDHDEVARITAKIEESRKKLISLGYIDFTFEDYLTVTLELLQSVISGNEASISHDELLQKSRDPVISDSVVMFFRFITSGELKTRSDFYEPFVQGLTSTSVQQFCKSSVEPMGEESDHVHITALSDALGIPMRIVYLDRSCDDKGNAVVNHHDFTPVVGGDESDSTNADSGGGATGEVVKPFITLLYRPGHYDILYPK